MTNWACIVGLTYMKEHGFKMLGGAGAARRFKLALIEHFGFAEENIIMLFDEIDSSIGDASNILRKLNEMIRKASSGDTLVFFYCGHGGSGKKHTNRISDYYLSCAKDTRINGSVLQSHMHQASLRKLSLTVILDSCRSAGLFQGLAAEHIPPLTEGVKLKSHTVRSPIMIASCRKEQNSITGRFPSSRVFPIHGTWTFKPWQRKAKIVTKYVYSSNFVEAFRRSIKLAGNQRCNLELVSHTAGILRKKNRKPKLINKKWEYNAQDPQLFCSASQTVMMFLN